MMVRRISSARRSPARWLFAGQVIQLGVGQPVHDVLPMTKRHDVVAVAVPRAHWNLRLLEPEAPIVGEDHDVGERGGELLAAAVEQVVEKHRLELGPHQQASIAFW